MESIPRVKLYWDIEGLQFALEEKDVIVIVDVFRFSSTVTTAIANGFTIYPTSDNVKGAKLAASIGAEMSGHSGIAKYSLSPQCYLKPLDKDNKKVVLYSPNGAACAELVKENDIGYIGCFLNAKTAGEQVTATAKEVNRNVGVIAVGEKSINRLSGQVESFKDEIDFKKFYALEDYLGCGAIISYIDLPKSPEAKICELAFKASKSKLKELLLESISGRYLVQAKRKKDVEHSSKLNLYDIVPIIHKGRIEKVC